MAHTHAGSHRRIGDNLTRDAGSLALAAADAFAEPAAADAHLATGRDVEAIHDERNGSVLLLRTHGAREAIVGAEEDSLAHREEREEQVILHHVRDHVFKVACTIQAVDEHAAAHAAVCAASKRIEQSAFAGATRAHQRDQLARLNDSINAVEKADGGLARTRQLTRRVDVERQVVNDQLDAGHHWAVLESGFDHLARFGERLCGRRKVALEQGFVHDCQGSETQEASRE